jgi:hypothetical protein
MERYVKQLCEGLTQKKITNHVLTFQHNNANSTVDIINNVTIFRIKTVFTFLSQPFPSRSLFFSLETLKNMI